MGFVLLQQPTQVSASRTLGQLVAQHRPPRWQGAVLTVVIWGFFFLAVALLVGSAPDWDIEAAFGVLLTGVGAIAVVYYWVRAIRRRWLVYENALVELNGSAEDIYWWDEIDSVTHFLRTMRGVTTLSCTVKRQDGKTLRIDTNDIKNIPAGEVPFGAEVRAPLLIMMLLNLAIDGLIDRAVARYQRGDTLDFKKFRISQQGFHVKNELLPWAQIADIEGDGAVLLVYPLGYPKPLWTFWLAEVPNRDVIPSLLARTQPRAFSLTTNAEHPSFVQPNRDLKAAHQWESVRRGAVWVGLIILSIVVRLGFGVFGTYFTTEGRVDRAVTYMDNSRYRESLALLNEAVAYDADNPLVFATRCAVYRELRNYEAAYDDCNHALELRPGYDYALVRLGRVYYREEQYTRAIAAYNDALRSNPTYAFALCNRGYSYQKMGDLKTALADFTACYNHAEDNARRNQATYEIEILMDRLNLQQ